MLAICVYFISERFGFVELYHGVKGNSEERRFVNVSHDKGNLRKLQGILASIGFDYKFTSKLIKCQ